MEVTFILKLKIILKNCLGLTYVLRLIIGQSLLAYRWWTNNRRQHQIQITPAESVLVWTYMRRLQTICTVWLQLFLKISFFTGMISRVGVDITTKEIKDTGSCLTTTIKDSRNFEKLKTYPLKKVDFRENWDKYRGR